MPVSNITIKLWLNVKRDFQDDRLVKNFQLFILADVDPDH